MKSPECNILRQQRGLRSCAIAKVWILLGHLSLACLRQHTLQGCILSMLVLAIITTKQNIHKAEQAMRVAADRARWREMHNMMHDSLQGSSNEGKERTVDRYSSLTRNSLPVVHLLRNVACDARLPVTLSSPQPVSTSKPVRHECKCLFRHPVSCSCIAGVFWVQPHWHIWRICPKLV